MENESYSYERERKNLFNEEGIKIFIRVRDRAKELLNEGGAFTVAGIMRGVRGVSGDAWDLLACVDMLVELGEIEELKRSCAGQYRTFVEKGR